MCRRIWEQLWQSQQASRHTCAVRSDGQLVCFGLSDFGQRDVPTDLGAVVAVSAGDGHTCAVRSDGQLVCFGLSDFGQCDVPTDLGAVVAVSARFPKNMCNEIRWSGWFALELTAPDNAMCRREFGSSCGSLSRRPSHVCSEIRMVSWSALDGTTSDSAMCRRIWEQLWQSQQAPVTHVQ